MILTIRIRIGRGGMAVLALALAVVGGLSIILLA